MSNPKTEKILQSLENFLLGKRRQLEYSLGCLLAQGHLLIEDVPGVGKTTLAKSIANCIEAVFKRIQFTSDLLPSDLIGVTVFHRDSSNFIFQEGPIFTNVLLADEINRANPKTQSALLEAMHDAQVSHDGKTMALPTPFFVVATQNSKDNYGTFPLPESQLDRFLMKIHLGYPAPSFEKKVIQGNYQQDFGKVPHIKTEDLFEMQAEVRQVHISDEVLDYLYRIIHATRKHGQVRVGVSPRGGQALYRCSQSLAYIRGRNFVIPDDLIELTQPVCGHRLLLKHSPASANVSADARVADILREILEVTPRPV